ncbi:MAG: nucleotidyltransferase domain-containing protein [Candidatus Bathyarchaeia archaeon]|nr:nucleotidyltransferase domain-containing protein [Candidatus Bathyarchaeota archaeon]
MYWVKYHLNHLRDWRRAVEAVSRALKDLAADAEAYVIGGAAEGRLTALSDIDVLICVGSSRSRGELARLRRRILARAMDEYGLPWDYPVELHVYAREDCEGILKRARKIQL